MEKKNVAGQVHNAMYQQLNKRGFAAPVDVLLDLGALSKEDYERWRHGKVDYLEQVCKVNLHKLSGIMKEMRAYARKVDLKPSWTCYKQWKCKEKRVLRFSKNSDEKIEKAYATHFLRKGQSELKDEV